MDGKGEKVVKLSSSNKSVELPSKKSVVVGIMVEKLEPEGELEGNDETENWVLVGAIVGVLLGVLVGILVGVVVGFLVGVIGALVGVFVGDGIARASSIHSP